MQERMAHRRGTDQLLVPMKRSSLRHMMESLVPLRLLENVKIPDNQLGPGLKSFLGRLTRPCVVPPHTSKPLGDIDIDRLRLMGLAVAAVESRLRLRHRKDDARTSQKAPSRAIPIVHSICSNR
jgi:hypothetical protein